MPSWLQWLLWSAAGLLALGTIWSKLLRPLVKLVAGLEQAIPLLVELTAQLRDTPNSGKILKEIIGQFRTDSGSSLRDVVNRIEAAATEAKGAAQILKIKAEVLEVGVAAVKELATHDRADAAHKLVILNELAVKVAELTTQVGALQNPKTPPC